MLYKSKKNSFVLTLCYGTEILYGLGLAKDTLPRAPITEMEVDLQSGQNRPDLKLNFTHFSL